MIPPRRPCRRTNNYLVANRSKNIMLLCVRWKPHKPTLDDIRREVLAKAHEKLSR